MSIMRALTGMLVLDGQNLSYSVQFKEKVTKEHFYNSAISVVFGCILQTDIVNSYLFISAI